MKITKQSLNAFLLASLVAFSPALVSSKKHGPTTTTRGAAGLEQTQAAARAFAASAPRFLQEEESMDGDISGSNVEGESMDNENEPSGDGNDEESPDEQQAFRAGPQKRECDMSFKDDEVEFECKAKSEADGLEIEDEIKFKIKSKKDEVLQIKVEYQQETETEDNETETETQYTVVCDRLIEYRKGSSSTAAISRSNNDNNNNIDFSASSGMEGYEWDVDEVVNEWPMEGWDDFSPLETDGQMMKFSVKSLNNMVTFIFTIHEVGGMDVTANSMKIDFLLEDYPWHESGDTYAALVCHIETEREVEIENEEDDEEQARDVLISFSDATDTIGFTPFGQFNWADFAEARMLGSDAADGGEGTNSTSTRRYLEEEPTVIPVVATISPRVSSKADDASKTFKEIAFSFVGDGGGASQIYWDPEAGIGYDVENTSGGASSAASFGVFVATFLSGVAAFIVL